MAASNTSHPGYDFHYLALYGMALYSLVFISSDVLFFYFTMYVAFRYDLIQHLVGRIGDIKSEYDTSDKQTVLLKKIVNLHSDTMRSLAADFFNLQENLIHNIFRFCRKISETYSLIVFFQAVNFMLTVVIGLAMFSIVRLFTYVVQ